MKLTNEEALTLVRSMNLNRYQLFAEIAKLNPGFDHENVSIFYCIAAMGPHELACLPQRLAQLIAA